ncbi:ARM repeat-containing protein [Ramaria rubella]|nr:ARM repeat-containing protein [Ramaria rubella]
MDIQTLSHLFATTYNPDPNVRKAAELDIRRAARQEGMIAALMQIIGSDGVDLATRQACSVYLKNRLRRSYFLDPTKPAIGDQLPVLPSDRQALKSGIIPLLIASPSRPIKVQIAHSLKSIVSSDFPSQWPTLLDDTKRLLNSSEIREVETGLTVLLEIVKAFRYRQLDRLTPQIVEQTFPTIVNIGTQLLQSPPAPLTPQSPEVPHLLHLILKIYKSTLVNNLSQHQQTAESIVPWGRLFFSVVNLQVSPDALPQDESERERCEWWKAKKWAYGTLDRLFHRFGSPSQLPSPLKEYLPFAEHFVTTFAPEIIKTYLHQLDLYTSGQVWLSRKCQYLIFQFLTECVKPKSTWALLKDHFERLVSSYVFPQMSFNEARQESWENDPVDFVRTAMDEYEDYSSPVSSASGFMMSLARNRTKTTFLPILGFINSVLGSNASAPQRYGALSMTSLLAPCMVRHPTVKPALETFLMTHILHEFNSPDGYMRYIACQVLGSVAKFDLEWSNEGNLSQHFHAVVKALDDPELPVRVAAVEALTALIQRHASVKTAVMPMVGKVVQDILKLSDETDLELLNNVMETMVKHYSTELLPVAAQLTARLCELYQRLVKETVASQPEEDDTTYDTALNDVGEDKTYAAMGMSKTILTASFNIVSSLDSSPDILVQLQEIIAPIIIYTLDNLALDLLSNVYDLVDSLTFTLRRISPCMWPIYELTYKLFKADAVDFLEEMLPCLDNFISYGKDVFIQRPDYRAMAVDIYTTAMNSDHLGENDRVNGCKIAESLLLNLRGAMDDALPTFVTNTIKCMDSLPETRALKVANLNVLVNAMLYNPAATLMVLEAQGVTRKFFEAWFNTVNTDTGLPRVHSKRLSILAICAMLEMDPSAMPPSLQDAWSGIMAGTLKIIRELPGAIEARKAMFAKHVEEEEDEEEEYSVDDLNLEGDADADVWDADSEYLEFLAKEGARLREKAEQPQSGFEEEEEEDDDDYDEWAEEELGYISPIDNVDPYVSFKHALTAFQMKNSPGYQAATASLSVEMQAVLMEAMALAESREKNSAQTQIKP